VRQERLPAGPGLVFLHKRREAAGQVSG
jgi:hypothetical protein